MKKFNSICIIDDDPITVFGLRKILESITDCKNLKTFGNGKLALENMTALVAHAEEIPEVIFLDINMPIMDGWQFLEEFISLPIKTKVRINIVTSSIDATDLDKWHKYSSETHHTLTYNNKPLKRETLKIITKAA